MSVNTIDKIRLIRSLFNSREDVFAIRWEKGKKSGYMPAYQYDPYHYRLHKMNGGTFKNYPHKSYLRLIDNELQNHLNGFKQIGIYPMLPDNSSWFLTADFDKQNWKEEAVTFLNACKEQDIPAFLERSRSGNGGHVWIFFDKPYPAIRSRKVFISILEQSGVFSIFDKNSSFDRLFPNQDFLSGKGLGNLIALPFYKPTFEKGNSCFINPETFEAFSDQWDFIKNIERTETKHLDNFYQKISNPKNQPFPINNNGKLMIHLERNVHLYRDGLTTALIDFLKKELNFASSEYFIKKNSGKNTFGTERYFRFVEEKENEVLVPRGFIGKLLRFCIKSNLEYKFKDQRKLKEPVLFSFNATLRSHQKKVIKTTTKKDLGIIVAPPGSGKTIMGLKIIADKKQPALIIVHRRHLLEQWRERVQAFLGIPEKEIGIIGRGRAKIGDKITIATIQSLPKQLEKTQNQFGTILIDECHHIPAKTFRNTIEKLNTYYLYGLTATPFRKNNDDRLIFAFIGDIIANISPNEIENYKHAQVIVQNTSFDIPFNAKTDDFEVLSKILIHDSQRNKLILSNIQKELQKRKRIAIITERKEHIDALYLFLKQSYEVITLSGSHSEKERKVKWKNLQAGNFQVLITTGQYFGEGIDLPTINSLFLIYPFSFKGKLIQYIGRVQRSEINPIIYDYRDLKIDYLNKLFLKRNTYYRKIMRQASLFDDPLEHELEKPGNIIIDKQIKVPIEQLAFNYGYIGFTYTDKKHNQSLEFEIENLESRPEFEVLKPYFVKVLKSKTVSVEIYAEIENGVILSQLATSSAIDSINKKIIESVKFQFLNKGFISQVPTTKQNILTTDDLPEDQQVYSDAENILSDILNGRQYKHSRHIQFLANKHQRNLMKLRFVLQPFSFVFLLPGKQYYHLTLETLDTEEATYIWHSGKSRDDLKEKIIQIDEQLKTIREKGRQVFLETNPQNFSKIEHNYSEKDKGFIIWKSQLEEKLI